MPTRRYAVRRSPIHGRGLFALTPMQAGTSLGRFGGRRTTWEEVETVDDGHTLLFDLGDGWVLDGGQGGNALRWLNHACEPNCQAVQEGATIWIETIRSVAEGEELHLDYRLVGEPAETYPCACGAPSCRGTMLAP